jgi:hypothetical protein
VPAIVQPLCSHCARLCKFMLKGMWGGLGLMDLGGKVVFKDC